MPNRASRCRAAYKGSIAVADSRVTDIVDADGKALLTIADESMMDDSFLQSSIGKIVGRSYVGHDVHGKEVFKVHKNLPGQLAELGLYPEEIAAFFRFSRVEPDHKLCSRRQIASPGSCRRRVERQRQHPPRPRHAGRAH
jgi:hypothetical protein